MSKLLRFQFARQITGALVVLVLGILISAWLWSGKIMGLFQAGYESKIYLTLKLPKHGESTEEPMLTKGGRVEMLGQVIGSIEDLWISHRNSNVRLKPEAIHPEEELWMVAAVHIHGDFARLVGRDSRARLMEDFAGFGGKYVELTPGSRSLDGEMNLFEIERTTNARTNLLAIISGFREDYGKLNQHLIAIMEKMQHLMTLSENLVHENGDLKQTVKNLNLATASINRFLETFEKAGVGGFLEPEQRQQVDGLLSKMETTLNEFEALSKSMDAQHLPQLTRSIEGVQQSIQKTSRDFTQVKDEFSLLARDLRQTSEEMELLTEGIQRSWLFRGGVERAKKDREPQRSSLRSTESLRGSSEVKPEPSPLRNPEPRKPFWKFWEKAPKKTED